MNIFVADNYTKTIKNACSPFLINDYYIEVK